MQSVTSQSLGLNFFLSVFATLESLQISMFCSKHTIVLLGEDSCPFTDKEGLVNVNVPPLEHVHGWEETLSWSTGGIL